MTTDLIPLRRIPYAARAAEAAARRAYPNHQAALDAATFKVVDAPGTYSGAFPGTRGWLLTPAAAEAISALRCHMPGGTSHRLWDVHEIG